MASYRARGFALLKKSQAEGSYGPTAVCIRWRLAKGQGRIIGDDHAVCGLLAPAVQDADSVPHRESSSDAQ